MICPTINVRDLEGTAHLDQPVARTASPGVWEAPALFRKHGMARVGAGA